MKTHSPYLYAGALLKTKEIESLKGAEAEKLISAPNLELAWQSLQDTFIGPYLNKADADHPQITSLKKSLDLVMVDTKKLLDNISPDKQLLDILWVKYDFHNLRVIIRGESLNLSDEKMEVLSSALGTHEFKKIKKIYDDRRLALLDPYLQKAVTATENFTDSTEIGVAVNTFYFEKIKDLASKSNYPFLKKFVEILIDSFNLQTSLRQIKIRQNNDKKIYITGGQFAPENLETEEAILNSFSKLGGETLWQEAIADYRQTGNHTLLRKTAEDYLNLFLKEEARLSFTPAKLFSHFNTRKRDVQAIQMIISGKQAGLTEEEIRNNLRQLPN